MSGVTIAATGVANLASVRAAFARLGVATAIAADGDDVRRAAAVVLPGVGQFAAGAQALGERGLGAALRERIDRGAPVLAICLGLQLCCEASDEAPGVPGLGAVQGRVQRFGAAVRTPQLGWNEVQAPANARLLQAGHAWFANSYRLTTAPAGWCAAIAVHGGAFVAALERDAVLLCQFHPELSGGYGRDLLRRWLAVARVEAPC